MNEFNLASYLTSNLWTIPLLLVFLGGAVCTIAQGSRYPRPSWIAFLAFAILLGNLVIGRAWMLWLYQFNGIDSLGDAGSLITKAVGVLSAFVEAGAIGMLILAIYAGRSRVADRQPSGSEDALVEVKP